MIWNWSKGVIKKNYRQLHVMMDTYTAITILMKLCLPNWTWYVIESTWKHYWIQFWLLVCYLVPWWVVLLEIRLDGKRLVLELSWQLCPLQFVSSINKLRIQKFEITIYLVFIEIFPLGAGFVKSYYVYAVLHFITMTCLPVIWVNTYVYSTELFTPQWRYIFIGLFEIPIGKNKLIIGFCKTCTDTALCIKRD